VSAIVPDARPDVYLPAWNRVDDHLSLKREDRRHRARHVEAMAGRALVRWRKRARASLLTAASLAARLVFVESAVTELGLELGRPARL
jgi:hypothetical protein